MEYRDLYDKNRQLTGLKITKHDPVPEGMYYTTVMVFIENSNGDILLQQRPLYKGGNWATTGGHPKSGESSLEGMVTEIQEELGVTVNKEELVLFKTIMTEDDFLDLYYLNKDISLEEMTKQDEEVEDINWFSKAQIQEMIKDGRFFKYHINEYNFFLDFLNNK